MKVWVLVGCILVAAILPGCSGKEPGYDVRIENRTDGRWVITCFGEDAEGDDSAYTLVHIDVAPYAEFNHVIDSGKFRYSEAFEAHYVRGDCYLAEEVLVIPTQGKGHDTWEASIWRDDGTVPGCASSSFQCGDHQDIWEISGTGVRVL